MTKKKKESVPPNKDSSHMAEIGRRGGNATKKKRGRAYFSKLAKRSHPRPEYHGGRKPKTTA